MTYSSWKELITVERQKPYFRELTDFLVEDGKKHVIYPPSKQVFNAFNYCPLSTVKTVILGMDPYHGSGQAHGLSFSVQPGITVPPSLRNIFKEINDDLGATHEFRSGCLENWAKQGILLLNTCLTVRAGQPGSHRNHGWETFTDEVIRTVNDLDRPVVIMLWGKDARAKKELLNNCKHLLLESPHPSPYSAATGFLGCKHFSKTNEFLRANGEAEINWLI